MAFPVSCPTCGKAFQLANEVYERKVAGKIVSIKCKQCQSGIRIDATKSGELKVLGATPAAVGTDSVARPVSLHDGDQRPSVTSAKPPAAAPAASPAPTPVRPVQPTLLGMTAPGTRPVPQRGAGASQSSDAPLWAVDGGEGAEDRELTDAQMQAEIAQGMLTAATLVWREGFADWQEISAVPALARYLPRAKPAAPTPQTARQKIETKPSLPRAIAADAKRERQPSAPAIEPKAERQPPAASSSSEATGSGASPSDDEEATQIFRTSPEEVKRARAALLATKASGSPPTAPAATQPAMPAAKTAAALPKAAPAAPAAPKPASAPLAAPRPPSSPLAAAKPASAPLGSPKPPSAPTAAPKPASAPRAAPKPPSAPIAAPKPPSSPLAAATPSPAPVAAQEPSADTPRPPPLAVPAASPPPLPVAAGADPGSTGETPPLPEFPKVGPPAFAAGASPSTPQPPPLTPRPPLPQVAPAPRSAPASPPPAARVSSPFAAPSAGSQPAAPTQAIPWGPGAPPAASPPMGQLAPNPFAVAATADVDFPQAKSKTPIVIAVVLGLLAVAGIVAVIATTSGSPPPVPAPAPSPAAPPAPVTQPTAAVTPTETATAAPTANTPPNSNGNPLAPPDASPRPSSGNFSDLFAQGVEKAGKGTPSSAQPFDADAAKRAVAAVLPQVAACKEGGSPVGQTAAAVTFDASGKVSGVTVGAPFAGTSTGTCMVTAFKQVRVAPFSGLPQTVSQVVSLR